MPKEYITRLCFDRNHRVIVMILGDQVCGGVCYRPFFKRNFVEIVFFAIGQDHQVEVERKKERKIEII